MVARTAEIGGPVSYLDFGGAGLPPVVCVHGLGGAAINWMAVAPILARRRRTLALDLRGFGGTPLGQHAATVEANQRLLDRFLAAVVGEPALLVGNSMGGLLSVLQAVRRPPSVLGLLLVDPALPHRGHPQFDLAVWRFFGAMMVPGLAELALERRARRWGAERLVRETLAVVCADPGRVPVETVAAHVELERRRLGDRDRGRALGQAARSLLRALGRRDYVRLYDAVGIPVMLVHGDRDRLVPVEFSRRLAERHGWRLQILAGVGHVPMLEVPAAFADLAGSWLDELAPAAV